MRRFFLQRCQNEILAMGEVGTIVAGEDQQHNANSSGSLQDFQVASYRKQAPAEKTQRDAQPFVKPQLIRAEASFERQKKTHKSRKRSRQRRKNEVTLHRARRAIYRRSTCG